MSKLLALSGLFSILVCSILFMAFLMVKTAGCRANMRECVGGHSIYLYAFLPFLVVSSIVSAIVLLINLFRSMNNERNVEHGLLETERRNFVQSVVADILTYAMPLDSITFPERDEQQLAILEGGISCQSDQVAVGSSKSECSSTISVPKVKGKSIADGMTTKTISKLAAILEDFWGLLFDFHGDRTPAANIVFALNTSHTLVVNVDGSSTNLGFAGAWKIAYNNPDEIKTWAGKTLYASSGCMTLISYEMGRHLVLEALRDCVRKLLALKGSNWLFNQGGGSDEKLIDLFAESERIMMKDVSLEFKEDLLSIDRDQITLIPGVPCCGNNCIWEPALVVCFGVWSIRLIFELLLAETQPQLWGDYTSVLNHLQGAISLGLQEWRIFKISSSCKCLRLRKTKNGTFGNAHTSAKDILELVEKVTAVISGCNGPAGSEASAVAFMLEKQNLASVIDQYKSHLHEVLSQSAADYTFDLYAELV